MIKVEKLWKGYNGVHAVCDMNMTVDRGEIRGLIGSNGAGKTTLIKCMAGIYRPDKGKVLYDEKEIYDMPEVKQRIAYVSDSQEFISMYSVSALIRLYKIFYPDFSAEKFYTLNDKFGLDGKKIVGNLSKGQKTKLAFMLAVAQNAEYLIMDEPESGLDAESRKLFRDTLIEEVEKNRLGVVLSSHNLSGIEQLCDSLTLMDKGALVWQGNLDEIMESVQKWQAVWEKQEIPEKLAEPKIEISSRVGKLTEFYTRGNKEENLNLLLKSGAKELEGKHITLEEIYCLLKSEKTD